jgi:hypothetical protein
MSLQQQMLGQLLCKTVCVSVRSLGTDSEQNAYRSSVTPHWLCICSDLTPLFQPVSEAARTQLPGGELENSRTDAGPSDLGANAGPSNLEANAGPLDLNACEDQHLGDEDIRVWLPSPDPTSDLTPVTATVTEQGVQCEPIQPDDLRQEPADDDPGETIHLPSLQTTQGFIDVLRMASLENSGMQPDDTDSLRDPGPVLDLEEPLPLLRSLRHFINNTGSSRAHYNSIREIEMLHNPSDDSFRSFNQVKCRLRWLSGVVPIEYDMCPNTCVAYTGPYSTLDTCPCCPMSRYFPGTTNPQRRFTTVLIEPVIQAFYGSCDMAEHMHHLERSLTANADCAWCAGGKLDKYDDISCGKDILYAWESGALRKSDVALQLSIDGAQLRADQASEAWVFIWIIHNLPPSLHYNKCFIIPGAIVPGPKKPGDIDSFLFPLLCHVAALQREGLCIYDASMNTFVADSRPLIIFATADSLGRAAMSGMVGHSGKFGCCLYCDMPSWHCKSDSHYYPAMHQPHNYAVAGCHHPDVRTEDLIRFCNGLDQKYRRNLNYLLEARNLDQHRTRHLNLGLCKQTLFSGMPHQPLPVPNLFTMDIIHSTVLNDPDLFRKLFTGKIDVYKPDD